MDWKLWQGSDQDWDAIISAFPHASFAQSSAWAHFQHALGRKVIRISNGKGFCQLVLVKKTVGSYWLAQRGPVGEMIPSGIGELLPDNAWFIRIEPVDQNPSSNFLRRASHDPAVTRLLDLSKSEEDLLGEMHSKTRYNIRVAEKHGLAVYETADTDEFLALQKDTASRDGFSAQSDAYVRKQFEHLKVDGVATVLIVGKSNEPLAANFMLGYGDTATYLYGASSSAHRNLMAPYYLHWEAIKWAKKQGYRWYDFWGCNPESEASLDYKKSWEGISRFKAGWGGNIVEYPGTFDLPLRPALYRLARKLGK